MVLRAIPLGIAYGVSGMNNVVRQGLPRADTQSGKSELYGLNDTKKYSAMYAGS